MLRALSLYTSGDQVGAARSLEAARRIDPGLVLVPHVVAEGHPLAVAFERGVAYEVTDLPAPRSGTVFLDGQPSLQAGSGLPVWFQRVEGQQVVDSAYVASGQALPDYKSVLAKGDPRRRRRRAGIAFAVAGGLALATSGVLYYAATRSEKRFQEPRPDDDLADLKAAQAQTNGFVIGAGVSLGVAAGCGIGMAVAW